MESESASNTTYVRPLSEDRVSYLPPFFFSLFFFALRQAKLEHVYCNAWLILRVRYIYSIGCDRSRRVALRPSHSHSGPGLPRPRRFLVDAPLKKTKKKLGCFTHDKSRALRYKEARTSFGDSISLLLLLHSVLWFLLVFRVREALLYRIYTSEVKRKGGRGKKGEQREASKKGRRDRAEDKTHNERHSFHREPDTVNSSDVVADSCSNLISSYAPSSIRPSIHPSVHPWLRACARPFLLTSFPSYNIV